MYILRILACKITDLHVHIYTQDFTGITYLHVHVQVYTQEFTGHGKITNLHVHIYTQDFTGHGKDYLSTCTCNIHVLGLLIYMYMYVTRSDIETYKLL